MADYPTFGSIIDTQEITAGFPGAAVFAGSVLNLSGDYYTTIYGSGDTDGTKFAIYVVTYTVDSSGNISAVIDSGTLND